MHFLRSESSDQLKIIRMIPETPQSLIDNEKLILSNIYRTSNLNEREKAVITGKSSDDLNITPKAPWDRSGKILSCDKALSNGDTISGDLWNSLQVWHAGLSCQLFLNPKEILFDIENTGFLQEFNDIRRSQILKYTTGTFRHILVYVLMKGTPISEGIAIEIDGDNHACLYPTGKDVSVSNIEEGLNSFTIDILKELQHLWKPYAVLQVRADGYLWPKEFPSESDEFPFCQWISNIIKFSDPVIVIDVSRHIDDYLSERLDHNKFMTKLIDIGKRYAYDCPIEHIETNLLILNALRSFVRTQVIEERNT